VALVELEFWVKIEVTAKQFPQVKKVKFLLEILFQP
jgi:hypothetical protein